MAGEDYTSDGSTWHSTLNLVKDGEVYNFESIQKSATAKRGLFAKLLDNVTHIKKRLIDDAVAIITNKIQLSGANAGIVYRSPHVLPDSNSTIPLEHDFVFVPQVTAYRNYTLPPPTIAGQTLYIVNSSRAPFNVDVTRQGGGGLATYFTYSVGEPIGWVLLVANSSLIWISAGWGGNAKDGVAQWP